MENLATRIKNRRKELRLSQEDLAEISGVKQAAISKIENGQIQKPTGLLSLSRALKCDPHWLDTGDGEAGNTFRAAWSPKDQPEFLDMANNDLKAAGAMPGYSVEALALAWLLDQVKNRLDKKMAEVEASAVILRYVNQPGVAPTRKPDGH